MSGIIPALATGLLLAGGPAPVVSQAPDQASVTLYHDEAVDTSDLTAPRDADNMHSEGLAFITETRTIDLPAGPALIQFRGVASTMVPQTAEIQGLPSAIVEQNFDYDLLTPGALIAKSVGRTVHLVRTDPKTGRQTDTAAVVRSAPGGVVLDEGQGKHEAFNCSGLPERLVFDQVPEGLADTPTLSLRTDVPSAGRYSIKLSYLATGLNWSADYVAQINPDRKNLLLTGWITLANFGSTSFNHAPVAVIAGHLSKSDSDKPVEPEPLLLSAQCWPTDINWGTFRHFFERREEDVQMVPISASVNSPRAASIETVVVTGATRTIEAQQLGDYKLYLLPEPTDMRARETKQVQFLYQRDVPFDRIYAYRNNLDATAGTVDEPATVIFRMQNKSEAGLGKPLPAGSVSVMEPGPDNDNVLAGWHTIGDMAVGLPVEIETGHAMDVRVTRQVTAAGLVGGNGSKRFRDSVSIAVENDKSIPISFELYQDLSETGERIVSESRDYTMKSGAALWSFPLDPGGRVSLDYTVESPAR